MTCKEDFESHIRSLDGDYNLLMVGDVYIDVKTQIEWRTWQKAWQAALMPQKTLTRKESARNYVCQGGHTPIRGNDGGTYCDECGEEIK